MKLIERTTVHSDSFSVEKFMPLYSKLGRGPNAAGDFRIPQRSSCVIRRLLTRMYVMNRCHPRTGMNWPVRSPERIAVVELQDERLCFRMRHLVFFEETLRLSTIANLQIPWLPFESPLITCLSGRGRVGIRIEGEPDCVSSDASTASPHINFDRLAAWSADTRFGISVAPGYANAILIAPATAVVRSSSLVIAGRDDQEAVGAGDLFRRVKRLIVP